VSIWTPIGSEKISFEVALNVARNGEMGISRSNDNSVHANSKLAMNGRVAQNVM
jgi:hypothetical protein